MKKVTVTKEYTWDMAHMLAEHKGLCQNLHGHTYKMQVEVSRLAGGVVMEKGAEFGMVIDFKSLKELVEGKIVKPLDHSFMYWKGSTDVVEQGIGELLKKNGKKIAEVDFRPTAEEMAMSFFEMLVPGLEAIGLELEALRLWETPTSYAEVTKECK